MSGQAKSEQDKLKIFISYSRDDLKFADQLDAALDLTGFECTIDRHGIHGGEDWKLRLGNLILEADTVVFVLSPTSAVSTICEWEVDEAARLGKRILPVLCRPLENTTPPTRLRDLNYVYFYDEPKVPGSGFGAGLAALVEALKTDLDWLREHTRLLERASEWIAGGRQDTALLFGSSIIEAKHWAERRPKTAPEVTAQHIEFIRASEEAETRRQDAEHQRLKAVAAAQEERAKAIADREAAQKREIEASRQVVRRTKIGIAAVSLLAAVAMYAGLMAKKQADVARLQTAQARSHLERAAQTSSLFRASQARTLLSRGDDLGAAEVSLNGVPDAEAMVQFERNRPFFPEAFDALHQAWTGLYEKAVLTGHASPISAGAVAGDGAFFVTGADNGAARIWDSAGKPLTVLLGHSGAIGSVTISPDSSLVGLGSVDSTATVWGRDGAFKARLSGHEAALTSIAFSPDGGRILTTSRDRQARVWDRDGNLLATMSGHTAAVTTGAFSPDSQRIVTGSDDGTAMIWSLDGNAIKTLDGHTGPVVKVLYNPSGSLLATASVDNSVRLWSSEGELDATLDGHMDAVTSMAFSPDGKQLLTGGRDRRAMLWNVEDASHDEPMDNQSEVLGVALSPDGVASVTVLSDGTARYWQRGAPPVSLKGHDGGLTWAAFLSADVVVTGSSDTTLRLWDMKSRRGMRLGPEAPPVISATYAAASHDVLTVHLDLATLWSEDGRRIADFRRRSGASEVKEAHVSRDASVVLVVYADGVLALFDRKGAEVASLQVPAESLVLARLAPDGSSILTADGNILDHWGLDGQKRFSSSLPGDIEQAEFSSDGQRIVTVLRSGGIDVRTLDDKPMFHWKERGAPRLTVISPAGDRALQTWSAPGEDRAGMTALIDLSGKQPYFAEPDAASRDSPSVSRSLGITPGLAEESFMIIGIQVVSAVFSRDGRVLLVSGADGKGKVLDRNGEVLSELEKASGLKVASSITNAGPPALAVQATGEVAVLDEKGRRVLTFGDTGSPPDSASLSPDDTRLLIVKRGEARIWPTYLEHQALIDEVKAGLPRCLGPEVRRDLYLPDGGETLCRQRYPFFSGDPERVAVSRAPSGTGTTGVLLDFAYYPPGDIAHADSGPGRTDRKVYLPDIAFPIKLAKGEHAYMNSQIWGFGGAGWGGKSVPGGHQCDPRNYDPLRQRDTYCEVRSWSMPLCPAGKGKQGQNIRPPTCEANRWDVVAVVDGVITLVTSSPTLRLKGADGTTYDYLHMTPSSIRVKAGDIVKKGDVLGRVGDTMGGMSGNTTINLSFSARRRLPDMPNTETYVPVYSSLIAAYRELKDLPRGIDADGNLIVDPDFEIGAGKIPRPPEY